MEKEKLSCIKHPLDYNGFTPSMFSSNYLAWPEGFKKRFLRDASIEYVRESVSDRLSGKTQLADGLESLALSVEKVSSSIPEEFSLVNTFDLAADFVFTNYFYQRECFKKIEDLTNEDYSSVLDDFDLVCKACEKHMINPYK